MNGQPSAHPVHLLLLRKAYRYLGDLSEMYLGYKSVDKTIGMVRTLIGEITVGQDGQLPLMKYLDAQWDHLVEQLRRDLPQLKEKDVILFCFLVVGFRPGLIALLMEGETPEKLYTRKCRLLGKIRSLPPKKAQRYLDLID